MKKTRIGVLVSGGGSNLQAIIDSCATGILSGRAEVVLVIANKADAYGLERARKHNIDAVFLDRTQYADSAAYCRRIGEELKLRQVDLVCLAGYLLKVAPALVQAYHGRILNIHPALLPKYGGKGMYGHHVHEAVIAAGEKESGVTVHFVDEEYDHGSVIVQRRVPVLPTDTADDVARRVLVEEHKAYPEAISIVLGAVRT